MNSAWTCCIEPLCFQCSAWRPLSGPATETLHSICTCGLSEQKSHRRKTGSVSQGNKLKYLTFTPDVLTAPFFLLLNCIATLYFRIRTTDHFSAGIIKVHRGNRSKAVTRAVFWLNEALVSCFIVCKVTHCPLTFCATWVTQWEVQLLRSGPLEPQVPATVQRKEAMPAVPQSKHSRWREARAKLTKSFLLLSRHSCNTQLTVCHQQ